MKTAPFMISGKQARLREQFLVAAILAPPTVFLSGENQEQMVLPKGKQTKIAPQFSTLPCKSLCQAIDVVNSIRTGDAVRCLAEPFFSIVAKKNRVPLLTETWVKLVLSK